MRILVISSPETIRENEDILKSVKLQFLFFPAIDFKPLRKDPLSLKAYEWLVVSSRKVLDFLIPLARKEELREIKVAAVGEATAHYLRRKNVRVDFVSQRFSGEHFAREFGEKYAGMKGKVLRPRSSRAPRKMEKILADFGIMVDSVPLYRTICPFYPEEKVRKIQETSIQGIIFTSPSTWRHFKRIFGDKYRPFLKDKIIGVIGPTTAKALKEDGYRRLIMPEKFTFRDLIIKLEGERP